jgi:hypothetical protein
MNWSMIPYTGNMDMMIKKTVAAKQIFQLIWKDTKVTMLELTTKSIQRLWNKHE